MTESRLKIFTGNSNRPLAEEICRSIGEPLGEATVTEHVHRLRLKLEDDPSHPKLLRTVRGVGYQLVDA